MNLTSTKYFILAAVLLLSPNAYTQISVDLDLKANMKLDVTYWSKKKKITGSKTSGLSEYGPYYPEMQIQHSFSASGDKKFPLSSYINSGVTTPGGSLKYYHNVRNIIAKAKITTSENNKEHRLVLTLDENRPFDSQNGIVSITDGKKNKNTWTGIFTNPSVTGTIRVGFTFPENVWVIKLKRKVSDNILNLTHINTTTNGFTDVRGLHGSLNGNFDPALLGKEVYVWGKPGSKVFQEFAYNKETQDVKGTLEFQFEVFPSGEAAAISVSDAVDLLIKDKIPQIISGTSNDSRLVAQEEFIEMVATTFATPESIRKVVESQSTERLELFLDRLAIVRDTVFEKHEFSHSKIAATILSARIAETYLKDLYPFCESTVVNLPYQNTEIKTSWLTVASFLLRRVKNRLEYHSIEHFVALIKGIQQYQDKGLTYAEVRNNKEEYKKILRAYKVLSESTNLRESPFSASAKEINYILGNTGSLGNGGQSSSELTDSIKVLSELETNFTKDIINKVRAFQPKNSEKVDVSDLVARAKSMESSVGSAIDALENGRQLFAVSETGLSGLLNVISNFGINHVQIYLQNKFGEFEFFRKNYFNETELKESSTKIDKCLLGE